MRLVIFDIDGTLLPGSTERLFARELFRRGRLGGRQLTAYAAFWLRHLPQCGWYTMKLNKAYLAGLDVADVERLAQAFVSTRIADALVPAVVARLRRHVDEGDVVVLLSGTLDCVASAIAATLGVAHVVATIPARRAGRYLAAPPDRHPFGTAKRALAERLAADTGLALGEAAAYADSDHDIALLEAVGRPVAVMPEAGLLRHARKRHWDILAGDDSPDLRPYSIS